MSDRSAVDAELTAAMAELRRQKKGGLAGLLARARTCIEELAGEVCSLRAYRDAVKGDYWAWQGDGEDHLESLTCPVLIRPEVLKEHLDLLETCKKILDTCPVSADGQKLIPGMTVYRILGDLTIDLHVIGWRRTEHGIMVICKECSDRPEDLYAREDAAKQVIARRMN